VPVAGAVIGAVAGPPGIIAGALIGAVAGAITGVAVEEEADSAAAEDKKLDHEIGVTDDELGAPQSQAPAGQTGSILSGLGWGGVFGRRRGFRRRADADSGVNRSLPVPLPAVDREPGRPGVPGRARPDDPLFIDENEPGVPVIP